MEWPNSVATMNIKVIGLVQINLDYVDDLGRTLSSSLAMVRIPLELLAGLET